jgi:Type I phosphodiesterase / nucleotide pyrophosphatase
VRPRVVALLLFVACSPPPPPIRLVTLGPSSGARAVAKPAAATALPARASAPVLLVVIVDQLGSWVFQARSSSLAEDGAFAGLSREGLYAPELRYEHATTSTAPGHAALFTGLPPRESGVFANERLDPVTSKPVSMFADPESHVVLDGAQRDSSSSAAMLRADTLADALRAQRPDAQIISLSLKDRAAIPGGGRKPDAAVWFDASRAAFVTSSAFARTLPVWVRRENDELKSVLGSTWSPLDSAWLVEHAPTPDDQAGEGDFSLGIRFPYDLSNAKDAAKVLRGYPAADRAVLQLARGALSELPNDAELGHPLLLMVSLSAFDYVGHVHGPDSWESWEVLRELDRALAGFFEELEQRFGGRLGIMLTADHGSVVLPETAGDARARPWCGAATPDPFERPCLKGERLFRAELEGRLQKAARSVLGPGKWIRGVVEPFAYFTPEVAALSVERRTALEKATASALEKHPGVARVFTRHAFDGPCPAPTDESLEALVCRSLPENAGDLYIVARPGSFFDPNLVRAHGINHGSPYLYDRSVPLFVRAPDHARAGVVVAERLRPADFTATAAALLHIEPPAGAGGGRDLSKL